MLGTHLAGHLVIVDNSDPNRIVITPAVPVPAREAWLYENPEVLASVRAGLTQAAAGEFSDPPDL